MMLGVCCGPEISGVFADAGFDYIEVHVQRHLMPHAPDAEFAPVRQAILSSALPCRTANCFLPATLHVTGPAVDLSALQAYVATACRRASEVGLALIVFGSGRSRSVPDGFPRSIAMQQLRNFTHMAGECAAQHGLLIAVEPLSARDTNLLNTVAEAAAFVRDLAHPAVRLLVDAFHWHANAESPDDIVAAAPLLAHAHIATFDQRLFPGDEPSDFSPFFAALRRAGYSRTLSVEAKWDGKPESAARTASLLRQYLSETASA